MADADEYAFTDFSERLRGPQGDQVAEQAARRLQELRDTMAEKIRQGVPASQFDAYRDLGDALAAGQRIVLLSSMASARKTGETDAIR